MSTSMTRRMFLAGCMSVTFATMVACGSSDRAASDEQEDAPIEQSVHVALPYSAGTGYEWDYTNSNEDVLELSSDTVNDLSEDEDVTGGDLEARYTFNPIAAGSATLTFTLARPWDEQDNPTTVEYQLSVSDNLAVSLDDFSGDEEYRDCLTIE